MNTTLLTAIAVGVTGAVAATPTYSQFMRDGNAPEITLLKQQLRLMEQKLDKLEKQTAANTTATAKTNEKVEKVEAKSNAKPEDVASANTAYPLKGPFPAPDVTVGGIAGSEFDAIAMRRQVAF